MVRLKIYVIGLIFYVHLLYSCQQIDPARNKILFNDNIEIVRDSLKHMQTLLEKLPRTYRINYFVDGDGYLYVNNTKLGYLKGAVNNARIRKDMSFENYTDKDYKDFFRLMAFLVRNHIDAASYEGEIDSFVFDYREIDDLTYDDVRLIVLETGNGGNNKFRGKYKILHESLGLKLLAPHDAKIK